MEIGEVRSPDYTLGDSKFSGEVNWVEIDLGDDARDAGHHMSREERFHMAMAIQ